MKRHFSQVFNKNADGSFSPKQRTIFGAVVMLASQKFFDGNVYQGIDLGLLEDESFEVFYENGDALIKAIYHPMKNYQSTVS